jgi:hypothetical protein
MTESEKAKDRILESIWDSLEFMSHSERRELAERMLCPPRPKSDMELMAELQRKYDELQADCKDLLSVVVNLAQGKEEPRMIEFNDSDGYPRCILDLMRQHATWSKEPINKE